MIQTGLAACAARPPSRASAASQRRILKRTEGSSAERIPRQILTPGCRHREIVLDANAAELAQLLDSRPVDLAGPRIGPRLIEQWIDEVDAGQDQLGASRA